MKRFCLALVLLMMGCANYDNQHLFEKDREKIQSGVRKANNQDDFATVIFFSSHGLWSQISTVPIPATGFALNEYLVAVLPYGAYSQQYINPGKYYLSKVHVFNDGRAEKISEVNLGDTKQVEFSAGHEYYFGDDSISQLTFQMHSFKEVDRLDGEEIIKSLKRSKRLISPIDLSKVKHRLNESKDFIDRVKSGNEKILAKHIEAKVFTIEVAHTQPDPTGLFTIDISTEVPISSLLINGSELGKKKTGMHSIKRIAPEGQLSEFTILATDERGNKSQAKILVKREISEAKIISPSLNPLQIGQRPARDAVAVVIGIADYKNLPKAEFANDDARAFYDYAIRALGVKPENIKLLVDGDADEVAILKTFRTWLPSKVKSSTDVYVYYSGHGYPVEDGNGLYLLPPSADREFIARTSIQLQEINADLQAAKPKSVTIFMDACYSGQARNGETLVASARPVVPRVEKKLFPDNFTVITASQADQWSSSSPELKHGIFSYYLMKGMEGEADTNKDGRITLGEMQGYLVENVGRQAGMMSRKQEPQLIGDVGRVLVGR